MEYFTHVLPGILVTILVLRPFTTFFHEMGHAAVPLLLSREETDVYIGSLGDPLRSIHFRLGRFGMWISYNPLKWNRGLCCTKAELEFWPNVISTIAGPAASFILGIIATVVAFAVDAHGSLKFLFIIFLLCALGDLWVNLRPQSAPVILHNGTETWNDGRMLKQLFLARKQQRFCTLLDNKAYAELEKRTLKAMKRNGNGNDEFLLRVMIVVKIHTEQPEAAYDYLKRLAAHYPVQNDDRLIEAYLLTCFGKEEEASKLTDEVLANEPDHATANNNKGYELTSRERFAEALPYLEKAIAMEPDMAYAYNNRGHAKLKTGDAEGGLADILHSLELDASNAYAYRNLGIYHLDKGNPALALEQFRKAEELDNKVPMLAALIGEAERRAG